MRSIGAVMRRTVMRRFQQFARSVTMISENIQLFTLIALNCAIRNGDAHLKNFGVLYDSVRGDAHLPPVYDLVTTTVYLPRDQMALTLNGTNRWPSALDLIRFAEGRSWPPGKICCGSSNGLLMRYRTWPEI